MGRCREERWCRLKWGAGQAKDLYQVRTGSFVGCAAANARLVQVQRLLEDCKSLAPRLSPHLHPLPAATTLLPPLSPSFPTPRERTRGTWTSRTGTASLPKYGRR